MVTMSDLNGIGWSLEDLEEFLGFPRGWTDIAEPDEVQGALNESRLQLLQQHGGDWTFANLEPKNGSLPV